MGNFFSPDGSFYRFGTIVADIMILSIVFIVCCLPVITIGPATTALYYIMTKKVSDRDGYLFKDFLKSFTGNFKQSLASWILLAALLVIFSLSAFVTFFNMEGLMLIFLPIQCFLILESLLVYLFIFPIIARFELSFKEAFKTAFFMANKHIFSSAACIAIAIICLIAGYFTNGLFLFIGNAAYAYFTSFIFVRLFKKYRPELDE